MRSCRTRLDVHAMKRRKTAAGQLGVLVGAAAITFTTSLFLSLSSAAASERKIRSAVSVISKFVRQTCVSGAAATYDDSLTLL